jgi:hypothetical protein
MCESFKVQSSFLTHPNARILKNPASVDINFDDLVQKKIDAPMKPPEEKFEAGLGDVVAASTPIDTSYVSENAGAWLDNF